MSESKAKWEQIPGDISRLVQVTAAELSQCRVGIVVRSVREKVDSARSKYKAKKMPVSSAWYEVMNLFGPSHGP
eukprot:13506955-Ditylum_brightwellii.AAC.2